MSLPSFYKLVDLIRVGLEVDDLRSGKDGTILPEISVFCTIRWLAGGSYLDIFAITGVSIASFYRVCYKTLRLIIACDELMIKMPTTTEECRVLADGFRNLSYGEAITNCVGAEDGYLLRINTPPK